MQNVCPVTREKFLAREDFRAFEGPRISEKLIYQRFSALLDTKITQHIQNVDL